MTGCRCHCGAPGGDGVHAMVAALAEGDVDRALGLGLLDAEGCPGCSEACTAGLLAVRDARRAALAARDRFRARSLRLQRRAADRMARRAAPATAATSITRPALPQAAADALARALAQAARKP